MEYRDIDNVVIRGAKLKFRNFAGKEKTYNREGDRNFAVVIDDEEVALKMIEDGWNVKVRTPEEEGDKPEYTIQVAIGYKIKPPVITMLTNNSKKKTALDEDELHILDYAEIVEANVAIRPYQWNTSGKSGIKAYLKTLYVVIEEDEFADEFDDYENAPF